MRQVLLVEDDVTLQSVLATALGKSYRVLLADNSLDALRLLGTSALDGVLLDLDVCDEDGMAVFSRAVALQPRAAIVVLSACDAAGEAVKLLRLGAADYLVKPCSTRRVLQALSAIFGQDQCCSP